MEAYYVVLFYILKDRGSQINIEFKGNFKTQIAVYFREYDYNLCVRDAREHLFNGVRPP